MSQHSVRVCALDVYESLLSDPVVFMMRVDALAAGASNGTATLSIEFDATADADDPDGMNVDRQSVESELPPAALTEDHLFVGFSEGQQGPRQFDACSDWQSFEFAWGEVDGTGPLTVDWQILVSADETDDFDLDIELE